MCVTRRDIYTLSLSLSLSLSIDILKGLYWPLNFFFISSNNDGRSRRRKGRIEHCVKPHAAAAVVQCCLCIDPPSGVVMTFLTQRSLIILHTVHYTIISLSFFFPFVLSHFSVVPFVFIDVYYVYEHYATFQYRFFFYLEWLSFALFSQ